MRTTGLTIIFFLLSLRAAFLSDHSVNTSSSLLDKKIVFNFPVINAPNTQKNPSVIDTAELRKDSWYSQVIKNIEESEYEIKYDELTHTYASPNRKQNLRAFYSGDQFTLLPRNDSADKWKLTLYLKGIYTDSQKLYSASNNPIVTQNGKTIHFNHNNQFITEYINSKEGIRQNFIISQKPAGDPKNLKVELEANKGWFINKVHNKEIHFAKATQNGYDKKITYNGLKVWDANGKELEAAFTVNENKVSIDVNTSNVIYPITIDPLSTTANWTGEINQANAAFGFSVSAAGDVNGDGYSDILVSAPNYDQGQTDEGGVFAFYGSATGLSATPDWTAESNRAGAAFGWSVRTAGDVNGDGYSDIIVGAANYTNSQFQQGSAFVYYGSATGLVSSAGWTVEGDQAQIYFGYSVSSAGDVNGDGFSDVIVGARNYTNGESFEGRAFVYYGSGSGLSITPNWTSEGNRSNAWFGQSVSSAGDVNGDGYSDIIIGAPGYYGPIGNGGVAFVYHGSATGLSITSNWTGTTNIFFADFGYSVSSAGDINGDGYSDVIVGGETYNNGQNNEGGAFVYSGSATGLSITPSWTKESNQSGAFFGCSVASAGDVNGDGYSDVIVGAYAFSNGENFEGTAYCFFGSPTGLNIIANWTNESNQVNAGFGVSVASAGDVNGDGYSDIIVGAWNYDNGQTDEGAAFIYHGSPSGLSIAPSSSVESDQDNSNFGIRVASAGDVNADGYNDVIIGAHLYDNGENDEGRAFVCYGSPIGVSTTPAWISESDQANAYFGWSVASAGDVNGDGYSDVIVGALFYNNGQTNEGRAFVFYGSVTGLSTVANWITESNQVDGFFGTTVASAGDVNGDGYSDVIVGANGYDNGQTNEGAAFVYDGSATGLSLVPNWIGEGNQAGVQFGNSVAGLGDVNGDGYSDVIIGAWTYNNGQSNEGSAFVYHGSATGLNTVPNWTSEGNQVNAVFGNSVSSAGDVNGDGYDDAIVGANGYDNGQTDEGRAFVYYGSATGLSTLASWTAESNQVTANFGFSVSSAGDVNGDGYSDVIVGAYSYHNGESDEGAAYVFYGSATGLNTIPDWLDERNQANAEFGVCVASAGDVNGDGYSDIIVGAYKYDNGQTNEGKVFLYYGNSDGGLRNNLRLYNQDLITPIQQSSIAPALFGAGLFVKSPLGRQKGKLVWETEKNGQPFSGNPITNSTAFLSQQPSYTDLGVTGFELKNQVAKQFPARATYLRARVKYDPVTAITGQVYGPWRYPESFLRGNRDIGAIALPVKIISFIALKQNENVLLKWITTDETPGVEYEIQHSIDGINFQTIKNITGFGNSNNQYEWLHNNPSTGKNFYRIHAVENGKEAYSVTRQINFDVKDRVLVYPNPAKSGSQLKIELTKNTIAGPFNIELFSINGQKKTDYSIVSNSNNTIGIVLPELPSGPYIVKVIKDKMVLYSGNFVVVQ